MVSKYAVSLMALIGSVAAQGYSNSSSIASTTSSASAAVYTDGAMPSVGGVTFLVQTDTSYQGTLLTLSRKRQSTSGLASCLSTCAASTDCVGTQFVEDTMNCEYFSSIDSGSAADTPGTDFALVESRATSSTTSDVFNGTTPVTSGSPSTRTPGVSVSGVNNSTTRATGSATHSAGASGINNSTTRATGSASRTSSSVSRTSGSVPTSAPSSLLTINGVLFLIEIDITYSGITIEFAILSKRAGETLDQCLTTCAANTACAGTAFEDGTCTFFSSIDENSRVVDTGNTFATVISRAGAGNGASGNGTTPVVNGTTPASNVTAESLICPQFNGQIITSSVETTFAISCSQFLIGTTFDALSGLAKRQAIDTGLPQTLSNCVDLCSLSEECVGTTFNIARSECTFYSDVAYSMALDGFDSATRVQDNSADGNGEGSGAVTTTTVAGQVTTVFVAAPTTATVYTTSVTTITVVAGGAAQTYPAGAVITTIYPVSSLTYTNTISTVTLPQQNAIPTVTVTVGSGAAVETSVVTVTVDSAGNVIGSSTAGAVAGGAAGGAGAYPTVTVHDVSTVSVCPTEAAAAAVETSWTTIYV